MNALAGAQQTTPFGTGIYLRDAEPNFEVDSWTTHRRPGCTLQHTVLTVFGKQFE